jgi:hypothetical protein
MSILQKTSETPVLTDEKPQLTRSSVKQSAITISAR